MSYEVKKAKKLVVQAGRELLEKGLSVRTWGNISARISDTQFVITPSGKGYFDLTEDDIVVVNIADLTYEGDIAPSSELAIHADTYSMRNDVNFVLHTHQKYASCLSITGKNIDAIDIIAPDYVNILGGCVPCAAYGMNASAEIRAAVAMSIKMYPGSRAVLMRNHGALCVGDDYDNAFQIAESLEEISQVLYKALCQPEIQSMGDMTFGQKFSFYGEDLYSYIDDFAMIAGVKIPCMDYRELAGNTLDEMYYENNLEQYMSEKDISCVLIKGRGVIYKHFADNDDLYALRAVVEKNCMAAILAHADGDIEPIEERYAIDERRLYTESYSRKK